MILINNVQAYYLWEEFMKANILKCILSQHKIATVIQTIIRTGASSLFAELQSFRLTHLIGGIFQNTFQKQEQTHRISRAGTPDWLWNWQFVFGIEKQRDFSSVLRVFEECVCRSRSWERRPFVVFPSGFHPLILHLGKTTTATVRSFAFSFLITVFTYVFSQVCLVSNFEWCSLCLEKQESHSIKSEYCEIRLKYFDKLFIIVTG